MSELKITLLGFGVVGQALARRLAVGPDGIRIVSVTDSKGTIHDPRGLDPKALLDAKARGELAANDRDARWAIEHVDSDVVVNLLPTDLRTGEPALSLNLLALQHGKKLVLAEKGSLALHAQRLRGDVRYSATVCGGTPVLELLSGAFRGDKLLGFDAILNGSTNFVLSKLEQGVAWESALAEARAQGILEADPSLDLLGLDAAAKAVILANAAWGTSLALADAKTQGIAGVTSREAQSAKDNGLAIRLVARGSLERGVSVAPVSLPRDHALVTEGTENALRLKFRDAGVITLRGPGAGGKETAGAVLNDLRAIHDYEIAASRPSSGSRRSNPIIPTPQLAASLATSGVILG